MAGSFFGIYLLLCHILYGFCPIILLGPSIKLSPNNTNVGPCSELTSVSSRTASPNELAFPVDPNSHPLGTTLSASLHK